jgi:hypothetical protein
MFLFILKDSDAVDVNRLSKLPDEFRIVWHWGKPFETESLALVAREAKTTIVDDRIYDQIAPQLPTKPWPLSQVELAIANGGPAPERVGVKASDKLMSSGGSPGMVLFVPSNDTHVKLFHPLAQRLRGSKFLIISRQESANTILETLEYPYLCWVKPESGFRRVVNRCCNHLSQKVNCRVTRALQRRCHQWMRNRRDLERLNPSVVVLGNDWSDEEMEICQWARERLIPTVCIQEGPQDFELPWFKQLQTCDHVFVQGAVTLKYCNRKTFFITGNPKFYDWAVAPLPPRPTVFINGNFTYGIYEEWRDRWVQAIAEACRAEGLDFFISKHPRDHGAYEGLPVVNSHAFALREQLSKATIVVSRFSQVVYEAMLMGRGVVYHNPHGEIKRTLTEDKSGAMFFTKDTEDLRKAFRCLLDRQDDRREIICRDFLKYHCGVQDGLAIDRCVAALDAIARGLIRPLNFAGCR